MSVLLQTLLESGLSQLKLCIQLAVIIQKNKILLISECLRSKLYKMKKICTERDKFFLRGLNQGCLAHGGLRDLNDDAFA